MAIPHARFFGGRVVLILATLAALLMTLAPPAQAAETFNERIPLSGTFVNTCTGEPFTYDGTLHTVGHFVEDKSGGIHFKGHTNFRAKGLSPSGAKYVINSADNSHSKFAVKSADNFTNPSHFNIIRQGENGTQDDYKARGVFHWTQNANGEYTALVANFEVECQ
jgi:hypothetical protein